MDAFIYILSDPRTKEIRYVGKATDVKARYGHHLWDSRKTHKASWVQSLKNRGFKPEMEVMECLYDCSDQDWMDAERHWISYLRFIGCRLTNLDSGGSGGKVMSTESRRKISLSQLGRKRGPHSEIHKLRISISNSGKKRTAETRENIRVSHLGYRHTEQSKRKLQEASLGRKMTPQQIELSCLKRRGAKRTAEQVSRIKQGTILAYARKKALRNELLKTTTHLIPCPTNTIP